MTNKTSKAKKTLLILCLIITFLFLSVSIVFTIIYNKYDLDVDKLTSVNNGIKVYSASMNNNTLYNTNRSIVEIETLPEYVLDAFIDTEDKRFYSHNGYDLKRIVKASLVNLTTGSKSQGASTISQQLIKNALLTNEKTYSRKLQEIILSIKMEKVFTKDEILEMYLNTIYFGSNVYGIENASKLYFDKSANELNLSEACCLAGLIKSPNTYSPKNNIENSTKRRNIVASLMLDNGSITQEDYLEVINNPIIIKNNTNIDKSYEEEAIMEACELLNISERELINRKYEIITFKDDALQEQVIKANNDIIDSHNNLDSISVVAENTGKVRAFYINSDYNLHNIKRQPASIFKPLAVYLPCLVHNILTPASQILDERIDYNSYSPKNYDNTYHGYVSMRESIVKSLNVPAVKALDALGIDKSVEFLNKLGFNLSDTDKNLALALGGISGVKLLDLVSAYSTIANMGDYKGLSFIDKIIDEKGKTIYLHTDYTEKIVDGESCYMLTDMLKDTAKTGTARRLNSLNIAVASKTGTAFNGADNTDLYNVSYTTEHTVLTWIANIKNNKLDSTLYSSVEPTEINKNILRYIYSIAPSDFTIPEGINLYPYDVIEMEENHRIIASTTNIERYIAYDYFKTEYPPEIIDYTNILNFNVIMSKKGAFITFNTRKNQEYKLIKITGNNSTIYKTINENSGLIEILDEDIFQYNNVTYYIESTDNISEKIEIRPKDYLVTLLNNEMLTNKRKWYV